ncbi:AraC family ligand binding domain-containing protein [Mesorhizobium sp. M1338]|uniref:AraC family ligand binding domain-containing protein n=1 Tax=Mesorhizobium sp. M1338 TaxID=2957085 RepID=UPI00333B367B
MGAGIARFDECSIAWTVLYDELIVTLEGNFRLRVGDEVFNCGPGDVLWVPENTPLHYEGTNAIVFYHCRPSIGNSARGMSHMVGFSQDFSRP